VIVIVATYRRVVTPTAEAGPAPGEARGVDDIRIRPTGLAGGQEAGGERK